MKSVGQGASGTLTIGCGTMAGQAVVPDLVRRATSAFPYVPRHVFILSTDYAGWAVRTPALSMSEMRSA